MKKSFLLLAVTSMMTFAAHANEEIPPSKDVVIGINDVFVPSGFDSESDAYVVVSGIFPNGCYQWKGVTVKDITNLEHEVTSTARVSQGMCIQVLIPFSKDVKLGKLSTGRHTLRFVSGDGTFVEKNLVVE